MADLGEELVGDFEGDGEDIDIAMLSPKLQARDTRDSSISSLKTTSSAVKRKHSGSTVYSKQKEPRPPNQDKKTIDSVLGQAMFDRICESNIPNYDSTKKEEQVHLRVKFSPVEIADLADPSMQRLVTSLKPRLTFCFKGQAGSFRKKKGYATACVSEGSEWVELLSHLCQVHFAERKLEFSINCVNTKDGHKLAEGSFSFTMRRRDHMEKLLQVIKDTPSAGKFNPECFLQVQDLPEKSSLNSLKNLLPFLPHPVQSSAYTAEEHFKGPINMCYRNQAQMEAVYNCFSDFTVAGHPLKVTKPQPIVTKAPPSVPQEASGTAGDKADSNRKKTKDESKPKDDPKTKEEPKKPKEEPKETPAQEEMSEEALNDIDVGEEDTEEYNDDDISCLARDLCSDMRESLNKLKQLETDNPNIQRIIELQSTVDSTLQRLQKKKRSGSESGVSEGISEGGSVVSDPWDPSEGAAQDKPGHTLTREERERHELTKLENLLEASDEQEKKVKAAQEMELKAIKEQQEKQRSNWAKKMLEDVKMNPGSSGQLFNQTAVKQEAQRLLMAREERLKARQAELARQRQEEEETLIQRDLNKQGASQVMLPFQDIISSGSTPSAMASPPSFVAQSEPQVKDSDKPEFMTMTEAEWLEMAPLGRPPENARVEIQYQDKRSCPVNSCNNKKRYFNSSKEFSDHWNLFHTEKMTVRFCSKCHAYFSTVDELWGHLRTRHGVVATRDLEGLTKHARSKVIHNPSFRKPWPFTLLPSS